MAFMLVDEAVELIKLEYEEMPGLKLTFWQAQRLWNLSDELCRRSLDTLLASRYLTRTADGAYVRRNGTVSSADRVASLVRAI